jgi:hypothetical protein
MKTKSMGHRAFVRWLRNKNACSFGLAFVIAGKHSAKSAWKYCRYAPWMYWLIKRSSFSSFETLGIYNLFGRVSEPEVRSFIRKHIRFSDLGL